MIVFTTGITNDEELIVPKKIHFFQFKFMDLKLETDFSNGFLHPRIYGRSEIK